ncbi:hypothetical protein, conserved [Eimeria acervulina]|uniref:Uncharacterized protein n=1 Tax=Eimeria acervulina TaxID=5801 RepID=U6GQ64_EIMAC|nr:hypothetical protein, conserved [Eimeria acervulina]CDI82335.1 hypothetical protein, conserved [Eimeria acervulina]
MDLMRLPVLFFWLLAAVFVGAVRKEEQDLFRDALRETGTDLSPQEMSDAMLLLGALNEHQAKASEKDAEKSAADSGKSKTEDRGYMDKVGRGVSKVHGADWFKKLLKRATRKMKKKCLVIKEEGGVPEAKDAPLDSFGYPRFDSTTKRYGVFPGVPLHRIAGFLQPIKVGAQDYVVQGNPADVLIFFECFSAYEIIGSVLDETGHWVSTPQSHTPVCLQAQNVGSGAFDSVKEMLLHQSVSTLVKFISPDGLFLEAMQEAMGMAPGAADAMQKVYDYTKSRWFYAMQVFGIATALGVSASDAKKAIKDVGRQPDFPNRVRHFLKLLQQNKKDIPPGKWVDPDVVNITEPVTITITMYPKPGHGVRATACLSSSRVSVAEAFTTIAALFVKRGVDDAFGDLDAFIG